MPSGIRKSWAVHSLASYRAVVFVSTMTVTMTVSVTVRMTQNYLLQSFEVQQAV